MDDQETPPPPVPGRDRSASPVHSLLFGDPKRNHLKPHADFNMEEEQPSFQPVLADIVLNAGSPTVPCVDTKVHNPADTDSFSIQNGLPEEGHVPPFKKSKLDSSDQNICELSSDLHSSTASTETNNHIDSLSITSVAKMTGDTPASGGQTNTSVTRDKEPVGLTSVDLASSRNLEAVTH